MTKHSKRNLLTTVEEYDDFEGGRSVKRTKYIEKLETGNKPRSTN